MGNTDISKGFDDIIADIQSVLSSSTTDFCKVFAISNLVEKEIIYNIDVPEVEMSEWSRGQLQAM